MGDDWFKWEPEVEERMTHIAGRYTPCEVIRQAYKKVEDPEIRMLLRIATTMCKCMANRITYYDGRNWGQRVYPVNPIWKQMKRQGRKQVKNED